jgi:hypothetical protein
MTLAQMPLWRSNFKGVTALIRAARRSAVGVLIVGLGFASQNVVAAPLNLVLEAPIIFAPFMTTSYDAVTDEFTADADFSGLTLDTVDIIDGALHLTADIEAGGILTGGMLSITGTSGSYVSGTLLTGTMTKLGYANNGSGVLEFAFNATGGDLAPFYTLPGFGGGIILSVSGYDDNDFNESFARTDFNTFANVGVVPIPAAAWLFGSALLGLFGVARRKRT